MHEYLALRQAIKHGYDGCMARAMAATGLNRMELDVLLFLANNPEQDTAAAMVRLRGLSKSHVSAAVEELVRRGMLTRHVAADNRREIHLQLTDAAAPAVSLGRAAQERFGQQMLAGITPEEQAFLERCMKKILANLEEKELKL